MPNKPRRSGNQRRHSADVEATYVCDSCGEEIVVPVDISGGRHQDYVEDWCERRLKSAARGGRKVQRWGWIESTLG
jgi:hypothetical protein